MILWVREIYNKNSVQWMKEFNYFLPWFSCLLVGGGQSLLNAPAINGNNSKDKKNDVSSSKILPPMVQLHSKPASPSWLTFNQLQIQIFGKKCLSGI